MAASTVASHRSGLPGDRVDGPGEVKGKRQPISERGGTGREHGGHGNHIGARHSESEKARYSGYNFKWTKLIRELHRATCKLNSAKN